MEHYTWELVNNDLISPNAREHFTLGNKYKEIRRDDSFIFVDTDSIKEIGIHISRFYKCFQEVNGEKTDDYIGKYYNSCDSVIKVLSVLECDKGMLFVCLAYSMNHENFYLDVFPEKDFNEYYLRNEVDEDWMPEIKYSNLYDYD